MASTSHFGLQQLRSVFNLQFLSAVWHKHLDLIRNRRFQPYFVIAFTLWLVGAVEIIQLIGGQRLDPRFWMFVAVLITIYSGVRVFRLAPLRLNVHSKWPAALREMVTRMQASGLTVFPAPTQNRENAGFVVVGRTGLYAMEVKSRKVFGSRRIELRSGNALILGGRISDRRPVQQAQAIAQTIREKLAGTAAARSIVRPIVVFLGDWRINPLETAQEVPVMADSELEPFLNAQATVLSDSEVAEISACLAAC